MSPFAVSVGDFLKVLAISAFEPNGSFAGFRIHPFFVCDKGAFLLLKLSCEAMIVFALHVVLAFELRAPRHRRLVQGELSCVCCWSNTNAHPLRDSDAAN